MIRFRVKVGFVFVFVFGLGRPKLIKFRGKRQRFTLNTM